MNTISKTYSVTLVFLAATAVACSGGSSGAHNQAGIQAAGAGTSGSTTGVAGMTGAAGQSASYPAGSPAGAPGGSSSTGGVVAGGAGATAPGGTTVEGGSTKVGGTTVVGGTAVVGGTTLVGGTIRTGGSTAAGGTTSRGGSTVAGGITAAGGIARTGGSIVAGGTTAAGGSTASGGAPGDGGVAATGWVTIHNDFFWYDSTGLLIQVRSGALRQFNGIYYWFGSQPGGIDQTCYASTDLLHWTYKGVPLVTAKLCDRMDVLYNDTTKQYVMFLKYDGDKASFGTATASAPEGPYTFLGDVLVDNNYIGDMSMYKDDDGTAYLAYVWDQAGPNRQHGIYKMSADYLTLDTRMYLFDVPSREAPHIFKRNGTYYYGVSETNGIQPSPTRYYTATNLTGPWSAATMLVTPGSSTTYETQCDFVFPFTGPQGTVYMLDADRWIPTAGFQGDYLWLPYTFDTAGNPTANYYQDWDLNAAAGAWREFDRSTRDLALGKTATASSTNGANAASNVTTATTYQNYTATRWESAASDPQTIMVDLGSVVEINRVILKWYSNYGKAFKIQVSTDSTTWTDVFSTTVGASYSVTDERFAPTTARYVRMNGTQRGNANGYSLFAFMVLNDP
jgi:F5/8 type C domain/Glycosyl hydrolases family 43